jgi:hypothetical protein
MVRINLTEDGFNGTLDEIVGGTIRKDGCF